VVGLGEQFPNFCLRKKAYPGVAVVACMISENLNKITIRPWTTARLTVAYEFASGQFTP